MQLACTPFKSGTSTEETSELGLRDTPYALERFDIPAVESNESTAESIGTIEALLRELNGKQFSLMVDAGYTRKDRWMGLGNDRLEGYIKELEGEVEGRLAAWIAVDSEDKTITARQNARRNIAREVYLHWAAKHICCITKEVEMARAGGLEYLHKCWNGSRMPWQCMNMLH